MECIFCKIAGGSVPTRMVFEDPDIIAFSDINPKAPIHILVLPREHIQSIVELKENHARLIAKLITTARDIAARRNLAGYKLVFNVGRAGGQMIDHLHLHLLGGWTKSEDRSVNV